MKTNSILGLFVALLIACGPAPIEVVRPVTVRPSSSEGLEVMTEQVEVGPFNVLNYMPVDTAFVVQVNGDSFRRSPHVQRIINSLKAAATNPMVISTLADAETMFANTIDLTVGLPKREANLSMVFTGNYDVNRLERFWKALMPETQREDRVDGFVNFAMSGMLIQQIDASHWLISEDDHKDRIKATSVPKKLQEFPASFDSRTSIRGWINGDEKEFRRMMRALKLEDKELADLQFWDVRLLLDEENGNPAHIDFRFECTSAEAATRLNAVMISKGSKPPLQSIFGSTPGYRVEGKAAVLSLEVTHAEADNIADEITKEIIRDFKIDDPGHP